jgi:hypothetical protein
MTSLIRDVLIPSAAAVGLLAATIADTAAADESFYDEPTIVVARAAPVAPSSRAPAARSAPEDRSTAAEAREPESRSSGIEPRCERTGRIGKFRITRCD